MFLFFWGGVTPAPKYPDCGNDEDEENEDPRSYRVFGLYPLRRKLSIVLAVSKKGPIKHGAE